MEQLKPFPIGNKTPTIIIEKKKTPVVAGVFVNKKNTGRGEWLYELRKCESGGNYKRNSGNGFFGAYQFMISTWNRVAPKLGRPDLVGVRPDLASPEDQDFMVIGNANISAGLVSQHPGCYRELGLSNKPPKE